MFITMLQSVSWLLVEEATGCIHCVFDVRYFSCVLIVIFVLFPLLGLLAGGSLWWIDRCSMSPRDQDIKDRTLLGLLRAVTLIGPQGAW